ncbi:MAG TPA: amino acid permease, partial [Terriglobales bacterium]|nr:amino acid permease [Terriglobales bacterium]
MGSPGISKAVGNGQTGGEVRAQTTLRKAIRLRNAVALYASSVLGSGVLVLPGLTAKIAGPGSIIAWILLSLASYPFAFTFASLSARRPESGGVYSFAKEAFGFRVGTVTGWLFGLWVITGAPAVTLIAASYLGYAFPLGRAQTFEIAFLIILAGFIINYRGIVLSNKVQLAIVGSIVALLTLTIGSSALLVKPQNFQPFLPYGVIPVGTAAALIFWSFLGYENTSNVAEEFEHPERDFHRSIMLSVVLISVLYIAIVVVTIGTLAYQAGGSVAPFAAILSNVIGGYGAEGTALLAVFIIFGTVNAYTTGVSRLFYAVARDGGFPRAFAHLNSKSQAPDRVLIALLLSIATVLTIFYYFGVDLETALLVPSGAAILVYVIGSAAGVKLLGRGLRGVKRNLIFPMISFAISILVLPFIGPLIIVALGIVIA